MGAKLKIGETIVTKCLIKPIYFHMEHDLPSVLDCLLADNLDTSWLG